MKPTQLILMLSFFSFFGCKSTKPPIESTQSMIKELSFYTGPCFGTCPVYTMTITPDGTLKYEGEKFTEMTGVWENKLDKEAYAEIIALFEKANLRQYPDEVERLISDIPTKKLSFTDEKGSKTVKYAYIKDQSVLDIEHKMTALTELNNWVQISKPTNTSGYPDYFITNEIIIQLKKGVDAKVFAQRYAKQGGEIIKSVSPPMNMWLFKYKEGTMTAREMITDIKNQPEVVEAEFNKQLEMRDKGE